MAGTRGGYLLVALLVADFFAGVFEGLTGGAVAVLACSLTLAMVKIWI